MTSKIRLAAVVVALLVPGAYVNGWLSFAKTHSPSSDFRVPAQVGEWTAASEERLDARSASILEPSSYVLRLYEAPGRNPVYLYVAFYTDRANTKGAHDPEICYPSSGWDRVRAESVELRALRPALDPEREPQTPGDSDSFRAKVLDMKRGGDHELVLYWFQPAQRWPGNAVLEELLYVYDAVAGRPQHAFVRLVGMVSSEDLRAEIKSDLTAFAEALAWPVRTALDGEAGSSPYAAGPVSGGAGA